MKRKKVIIDTDIGDDIDDAFALALAMQMPELEILGVVTVFKNVAARCRMAKMILDSGGRNDIPVYEGVSRALVQTEMFDKKIDFDELPKTYIQECDKYGACYPGGIEFYVNALEKSDEPVTIVTIGALTNVALLLNSRPDLAAKIEKIVIMGGAYDVNFAEYNFSCDPEAAKVVLESDVSKILVGIDVTFKCYISDLDMQKLKDMNSPVINAILKMRADHYNTVYLHDPLALYAVIDESCLMLKKEVLTVETSGRYSRGMVVKMNNCNWNKSPEFSSALYAYGVDSERFVSEFIGRLLRYNTADAGESNGDGRKLPVGA